MGLAGTCPRLFSASSQREISLKGLVVLATFTELSALDSPNVGGALRLLEGCWFTPEPNGPEMKSSEELSELTLASGGLAEAARLRRVTKRPADRRRTLKQRKGEAKIVFVSWL